MASKKISEVIIKITGKGIKAVNTDISKLLGDMDELTAAAKGLNASLNEGGRSDAILGRVADSAERTEKEFKQLNTTSANTLKMMEELLQQTAFATEDARDSATALGKTWTGLGGKGKRVNNALKDVNRQGTNQVRVFSKMARSAGKLTMIYAAVAANVFVLTEAFRIMNEASSVARLSEVSSVMSNEMGVSIKSTANALYDATDAAISYQEALKLAAASAAYGFDTAQMEKLALVAKRASVVLGVDMQDALRRVTRGIAKQEVELLDELGLTIRMNEAFSKYAATHGLAASSLNTFQRQAAFTNEVIKKSADGLGAVDDVLASTEWEKFGAEVSTATNEIMQAVATSDLMVDSLKYVREGLQDLRADPAFDFQAKRKGASNAESVTTPGAQQLKAVKAGDTRAAVAAQVTLNTEVAKEVEYLKTMVRYQKAGAILTALGGAEAYEANKLITAEYRIQGILVQGLLDLQKLAAEKSGLTADQAHRTNEALRELGALGKTFTNEMDTFGNKLFGTADVSIQKQIDDINAAAARASEASNGQFSNEELLARAKTSADELAGKAKSIAEYQALALSYRSSELDIANQGLRGEEQKQAIAEAALSIANARLVILERESASETVVLKVTKDKVAAEETLLGLAEARLQRTSDIRSLEEAHLARNDNAVGRAEEGLMIAQRNLDMARAVTGSSVEYLRSLEAIVLAKERGLQVSKEQSAEEEKKAYFSIANDLAGNIGALDAGMGQATSGLINMAQGWETLGNSAASSAEKIKAASQIAGGFQSALGGLINSAAGMVASGIDLEIAAVKKSGLSQEAEEKKVTKLQKKKIKEQEKYTKASIILNTAMGVARSLGELPFPANFIVAGLTAAAGAMAYQQASNTASAQLASLGSGGGSSTNMEVTVGKASTPSADVSQSASGSERSQMLGDRGVYGRASAGSMKANTPYLTSESGRELVIPKTDSKIVNASDTEALLTRSGGGDTFAPVIQVSALDAQSLEERMPEILTMLQEQAEQQGFSLTR